MASTSACTSGGGMPLFVLCSYRNLLLIYFRLVGCLLFEMCIGRCGIYIGEYLSNLIVHILLPPSACRQEAIPWLWCWRPGAQDMPRATRRKWAMKPPLIVPVWHYERSGWFSNWLEPTSSWVGLTSYVIPTYTTLEFHLSRLGVTQDTLRGGPVLLLTAYQCHIHSGLVECLLVPRPTPLLGNYRDAMQRCAGTPGTKLCVKITDFNSWGTFLGKIPQSIHN